MFYDRREAGQELALPVREYMRERRVSPQDIAVVAVPRGGVPVAVEVALNLRCALDLIVCKKVGAPFNSEQAVGAASSTGLVISDNKTADALGIDRRYMEAEAKSTVEYCRQLENRLFREQPERQRPMLNRSNIVIVDDGVATGMTLLAAIESFKNLENRHVIIAAPVISGSSYNLLERLCDQVICLEKPAALSGISQFYENFSQVSEAEVIEHLNAARSGELVA